MSAPSEELSGRSLLHYLLLERLGAGGMGEVYKARDVNLDRIVAVKILPAAFADRAERIARFEREARIASSLSHPSIAAVYEVGQAEGVHFIAMEYVEGQGLAAWVEKGRPALSELLRVMEQVGDALAQAHHAGVLHRDLKPANVIVSREGRAKLLDFGLAKAAGDSEAGPDAETRDRITRAGTVMGTLAYMSPEQARGHPTDRRSDVFSFGILLFEAVAGVHPFPAAAGLEAAAAVLRDDPIPLLRQRRVDVPPDLVRLLAKALEKDPARRYQFMDDLVVDLRAVRRALDSGEWDARVVRALRRRGWLWLAAGAAGGLALGAALFVAPAARGRAPDALPIARTGVRVRPLTFGHLNQGPSLAPQGDRLCYSSTRHGSFDILLQDLATGRTLRVTDDPGDELEPAFSPDGQTIAFSTGDGKIQTVPALGGAVRTLVPRDAGAPSWSPDGQRIAFRSGRGLLTVNRTGGPATSVVDGAEASVLTTPVWSPDGRWLVFSAFMNGRYVLARVAASGGRPRTIGSDTQALGWPVWTADGNWIVGSIGPPREYPGEIWSVPVANDGDAIGRPIRVLGGVLSYMEPSISRDARRMAFEVVDLRTQVSRIPLDVRRPVAEPARLPADARVYSAAVAPDGSALVVVTERGGRQALWTMSPAGGATLPLREGVGDDEQPAWSPDGQRIALSHIEGGSRRIGVMASSGGPLRLISEPGVAAFAPAWSPDGRWVAFTARGAAWSLRVVSPSGGPTREVARAPHVLSRPSWSPDGRLIAVTMGTADGQLGVGIVPLAGGSVVEALRGARSPLWLPDGRLVFLRESHRGTLDIWTVLMGVEGVPRPGQEVPLTRLGRGRTVDPDVLSSDGRFVYFTLLERARNDIWLAEAPSGP